jgi:hypothetical protein
MAGETANIAEIAEKVACDIFSFFKWEILPIKNENFQCHKVAAHANKKDRKHHTHPVDVVFRYRDPYLNQTVYLNTDLKSFAKDTINASRVRQALIPLARAIDCARGSSEWQERYVLEETSAEVRGLLFIYNHDNKFDGDFFSYIRKLKAEDLEIKENQLIHIIEPKTIRYLRTVVSDMAYLAAKDEFPMDDYSFLHPDLVLHKSHGEPKSHPATIESMCGPYMLLEHGEILRIDSVTKQAVTRGGAGYIVYYRGNGSTDSEFLYLLDCLSRLQLLRADKSIKIRVANESPDPMIKSNFERAKNQYCTAWNYDRYKKSELERIEFGLVSIVEPNYIADVVAWKYD